MDFKSRRSTRILIAILMIKIAALAVAVIALLVRMSQLQLQVAQKPVQVHRRQILPVNPSESPEAALWPLPASFSFGATTVHFSRNIEFITVGHHSKRLADSVERYRKLMFIGGCLYSEDNSTIIVLNVTHSDNNSPLEHLSENYSLHVPSDGSEVRIHSESSVGAIRALETLSQLIKPSSKLPVVGLRSKCESHSLESTFVINNAPWTIDDKPRFKHRGLLLDTSRHFIEKYTIFKILDGMAATKLNVFHWHIVDAQSFPLVSLKYPQLSAKGAYSEFEVYSPEDVREVIEFASNRAIRVIPELDVPGHTFSWGLSTGLVVCPNKQPWSRYCAEPPCGQLDITRNATYSFLEGLLSEQAAIFLDSYFHLGSDEVNEHCYLEDDGVSKFLKDRKWTVDNLLQFFQNRMQDIIRASGKTPVYWEEVVLDHNVSLPHDSVIQAWKGFESIKNIAEKGYRVIASPADAWYLDCGRGSFVYSGNSWCDPFKNWGIMHAYDPTEGLTEKEASKVIGGEVAMWTELADDTNVQDLIFPRAAAAAEALWSAKNTQDWNKTAHRLDVLRSILVSRDIKASPIWPQWCTGNSCANV